MENQGNVSAGSITENTEIFSIHHTAQMLHNQMGVWGSRLVCFEHWAIAPKLYAPQCLRVREYIYMDAADA